MTEFSTNELIAIGTIATAIILGITLTFQLKDRKPKFDKFQRKKDNTGRWYIYVGSPSKVVRHCKVTFKGQELFVRDQKIYEKSIGSGSGGNFDMPDGTSDNDDGIVSVKNGIWTIEKAKFNEMEIEQG